jgi:hypothetical protein
MTTAPEVKRWTRSILAEHLDLALKPRLLYLRPVHHVFRTILFIGSSDRTHPKPCSNYVLLFSPPSGSNGNNWNRELMAGRSTDPEFQNNLARTVGEALEDLRPVGSIEGLADRIGSDRFERAKTLDGLSHEPMIYASILAALGRLAEAAAMAQNYIDKNETRLLAQLAHGQAIRAQKPRSHEGQFAIGHASHFLKPMNELRQLVAASSADDRRAVAALLHDWERQGARRQNIEDIWEPSPFPIELI